MAQLSLQDISKAMRDIDICMMTTRCEKGNLESRPMSNNRQVDYSGESFFFADGDCSAVKQIIKNPSINLSFIHQPALFSEGFYLSVSGHAELIHERAEMEKHWVKDLDVWFEKGIDTPNLVLIKAKARHLKYWKGAKGGEISI